MAQSDIYSRIYDLVRQVPAGRVTTYGAIARAIGAARGARLVGMAMNHSHTAHPPVPAHRVVNRAGLLTGKHHFAGEYLMQEMLESEGVIVEADKVHDFASLYFDSFLV